jgi:pimeloyl-ACP methyl ester carboxylesterase
LWYWDTGGTGQPVIFMHAGTQSAAGWGYQQPVFARAGYRVIAYSRRGHYRSEGGDPRAAGTGAEDLQHVIDHLGLGRVHLVALAQGGYFAIDYALLHPERLLSLSIVSSLMGISEREKDYREANARLRPPFFAQLPNEFKELHPSYRAGNPDGVRAWLELEHAARTGPRIEQARLHELTWARLESIRVPCLLMTGDGDLYTPPALLRMQAAHMPHAELAIIREAGHSANWEQPAAFNDRVLAFLAKHRPNARD